MYASYQVGERGGGFRFLTDHVRRWPADLRRSRGRSTVFSAGCMSLGGLSVRLAAGSSWPDVWDCLKLHRDLQGASRRFGCGVTGVPRSWRGGGAYLTCGGGMVAGD